MLAYSYTTMEILPCTVCFRGKLMEIISILIVLRKVHAIMAAWRIINFMELILHMQGKMPSLKCNSRMEHPGTKTTQWRVSLNPLFSSKKIKEFKGFQ